MNKKKKLKKQQEKFESLRAKIDCLEERKSQMCKDLSFTMMRKMEQEHDIKKIIKEIDKLREKMFDNMRNDCAVARY